MTIARYCGGLILALSFAGMGAAVGCTRAADDSRDISEEAVGMEEQALSGVVKGPTDRWDDDDYDYDYDDDYCDDCCDEWEATVCLDADDAKFVFIEVDDDCEVDEVKINGCEVNDFHPGNGPHCNEDGFRDPDYVINLNKLKHLFWDDDLEITVRLQDCEKDHDNIRIALWENGHSCDEVDCDDIFLACCDD